MFNYLRFKTTLSIGLTALVPALFALACEGKVGPPGEVRVIDLDLVGSWRAVGTNLGQTLAQNLRDFLLNIGGLDEATA